MPLINRKYSTFKRPKQKVKYPWQRNDSRYYNMWTDKRNLYISQHPLDELELLEDKVVVAQHVHHIIPFGYHKSEADRIFYLMNEDNFISLTVENHLKIHNHFEQLTTKQQEYIKDKIKLVKSQYITNLVDRL